MYLLIYVHIHVLPPKGVFGSQYQELAVQKGFSCRPARLLDDLQTSRLSPDAPLARYVGYCKYVGCLGKALMVLSTGFERGSGIAKR